ncbi:MAG: hypothetical protein EWM72_01946 [Nitrospira sp.]|nr:MAG: hypothetical protein EWM72_01946 [Nitrospira sp.]
MIEQSRQRGVVDMRQSTRFGFENQHVDDRATPTSSRLTSPGPFHIHTQARAKQLSARGGCASCCGVWVERDIQENHV